MTPESVTDFLTGYIRSLSEETRNEAKGPRHGFDHVIYEIALSEGMIPTRLSFYRQGEGELAKPKKEPEHGVDMAFLSRDGTRLTIFVLKDEVLSYRNWTAENFDYDLRRARDQDISTPEFLSVTEVCVVLAYNKDEDEEGVESFEKFVKASGTRIGDRARLVFERWNLTAITERVQHELLTPSLLPESFFRRFTYLCWQVGDFTHGSPQWREVLLPDWSEFLASVLAQPVTERSVRLISVALIILRSHGKKTPSGELEPSFTTGWIDLVEWAMLALWDAARQCESKAVKTTVFQIWINTYIFGLSRYYEDHLELIVAEHSLEIGRGSLQEGASSYLAFWHMGRLGILAMAAGELMEGENKSGEGPMREFTFRLADWIVQMLNANPSCQRPMLDSNHIEIFLIWRALAQCGRWEDALNWFHLIFQRLLYRRLGRAGNCRVIDYGNSWESLFEFLATGEEPHAGFGKTSYLLLMMMEIALGAPDDMGHELATVMHRQLICADNGDDSDTEKLPFKEQVELMGWIPSEDWPRRILNEKTDDGISLPARFSGGEGEASFIYSLKRFVDNTWHESPSVHLPATPPSCLVLACLKHVSPLPSEFWRGHLFTAPIRKE